MMVDLFLHVLNIGSGVMGRIGEEGGTFEQEYGQKRKDWTQIKGIFY